MSKFLNAIADMHSKKKAKKAPEGSPAEEAAETPAAEGKEGGPPDSGMLPKKKANPFAKGKK